MIAAIHNDIFNYVGVSFLECVNDVLVDSKAVHCGSHCYWVCVWVLVLIGIRLLILLMLLTSRNKFISIFFQRHTKCAELKIFIKCGEPSAVNKPRKKLKWIYSWKLKALKELRTDTNHQS